MPTALSDPSTNTYLALIVAVVITAAIWVRRRTRTSLIVFAAASGILAALYLIDKLVESPREEATRRTEAMAAAATARNPDAFLENVSASFSAYGANRDKLRGSPAWALIDQYRVRVAVSGFGHDDFQAISNDEIEIGFRAKAEAATGEMLARYVKARFVRDPDGKYRVKSMKFYDYIDTRKEDAIPGFP